jgi:hypothetical protein
MTDEVTAELAVGSFPAAEGLGSGREFCVEAEDVEEAIGVEAEQVSAIGLELVLEGTVEEADVGQIKRLDRSESSVARAERHEDHHRCKECDSHYSTLWSYAGELSGEALDAQ